jgi:F-type H+-transporting ATPase subunit delta
VKITTAAPISDELRNTMVEKVKSGTGQTIDLESVVDEDIIGGFLLETEGRLVDASIIRDLKDIRKQFENNDYIHKIR